MVNEKRNEFVPSGKLLNQIFKILVKSKIGRTNLAKEVNVNYTRLVKHLGWLEQKGFVKMKIEKGKVIVMLTKTGKRFAKTFSSFK
jgi:predicted transcriptional regulator